MTEPKFHVGQHVAVCTSCLSVVIPATQVAGLRWQDAGLYTHPITGNFQNFPAGWVYSVVGAPTSFLGSLVTFRESSLRPIDPDTEYQETTENEEIEA